MDNLQVFNYEDRNVRTVVVDNEPWWVLKDVCDVLGILNATDVAKRLDEDEVTRFNLGGLSGESNIINESGLYSVILRSDKSEAKKFKKWITSEVLPSIRKHGAYMTEDTIEKALISPDFLIQLAGKLKEEKQARLIAEQRIEMDKPKVLFADAVTTSKTDILVGELAKILKGNGVDIGEKRFFQWLRENNYLISRKGTDYNAPTQKSMELGLFRVKETAITHSHGNVTVSKTTKVTGKGQQYFINKFIKQVC